MQLNRLMLIQQITELSRVTFVLAISSFIFFVERFIGMWLTAQTKEPNALKVMPFKQKGQILEG